MIIQGIVNILQLLPSIYAYVLTLDYRYVIFTGAKDTGKTYAITLILLIKFLIAKNADIVVLRKYNKDHLSSTYKQFTKLIHILDKYLSPFGFKILKNFKFTRVPSPEIVYIKTGQRIMFASLDDPGRAAGMTTEDPARYIRWIYVEEPIEVSDLKGSSVDQQIQMMMNFETIEDSLFRADESIKNPRYQVYMSMNMWEFLRSWVYDKYPYSKNMDWAGNREHLENRGWIKYEDPDYMGGQGIILLHTSYKVLDNAGILSEEKKAVHESRRRYHPDVYDLVSLGIPSISESMPLLKFEKTIMRKLPDDYVKDYEISIPTFAGIDLGQLHDDSTMIVFENKFDLITKEHIFDLIHITNDSLVLPANEDLDITANTWIRKIISMADDNPGMRDYGFKLIVHRAADFKIFHPFLRQRALLENEYNQNLQWINIIWGVPTNKAENVIGARAGKHKLIAEMGKLVIENGTILKYWLNQEYDKNMKRVEDKRKMDIVNGIEQYINSYLPKHQAYWHKQNIEYRANRTAKEKLRKKIQQKYV